MAPLVDVFEARRVLPFCRASAPVFGATTSRPSSSEILGRPLRRFGDSIASIGKDGFVSLAESKIRGSIGGSFGEFV